VREAAGKRTWLAVMAAMLVVASAQSATRSLDALVDAVIRKGPDNQLPAHLSVILGVSAPEQRTPVKQAVVRDGYTVRTFNVCTANHNDLVMMTYNEQSHSAKAYLVSPAGVLRKAVYYQAGDPANERSLANARPDFLIEYEFWTNLSAGGAASTGRR
jgi:hypothetical protein